MRHFLGAGQSGRRLPAHNLCPRRADVKARRHIPQYSAGVAVIRRTGLRRWPVAEDVTLCDNRVALYTPKATAMVVLRRRNATGCGLLPPPPPRPQADEAGADQQQRGGFGDDFLLDSILYSWRRVHFRRTTAPDEG